MSKAGGLINKHVLGGQDHSKTNAGAGAMDGSAAGGAATPPPKAAKPGGFGGVNMGTFRDAAKGMQAMNQINRAFSPQSAEAPAAAAPAPPPPPPAPTGAALPPPSRTGAPPPARNGGIGSCTALYDYEAAVGPFARQLALCGQTDVLCLPATSGSGRLGFQRG